jgi:hypothetical protein
MVLPALLWTNPSPAIVISALFTVQAKALIGLSSTTTTGDDHQRREDQMTNTSHIK